MTGVQTCALPIFLMPKIPDYATNNGHMFYMKCESEKQRNQILTTLREKQILAVFHYLSLHNSSYYLSKHDNRALPNADNYSNTLFRLPMYFGLGSDEVKNVINCIVES